VFTCPEGAIEPALAWATCILAERGCEEPRLDAELLLAHLLQWKRSQLHAHSRRLLTPEERAAFPLLVQRRAQREPLAYILGHREFYGLDLIVDRRVLIPRPETELLVDLVLAHVSARRAGGAMEMRIADVGTGNGAIAIALASKLPGALLYGLDISADALAVAAINCHRHGVAERVITRQGDLLTPLSEQVDCIVANLPYVRRDEWAMLSPEIREYEPGVALDGGEDGLFHIRRLLAQAGDYLAVEGAIFLEIGATQGPAALALAQQGFPGADIRLHRDYAELDRVLAIKRCGQCRGKALPELCP